MVARYNAMVIDDDPNICEVISLCLEGIGIFKNIIVANDGVTATNKLSNQQFDVILLDLNLPKKDGVKILSQIKEMKNQNLNSIIIVSGELDKTVLENAIKNGAKNFMVKPFEESALKTKVLNVIKSISTAGPIKK
ncbi:MAG: hypothetical protein A2504_13655 [Bdellovibrionales bacterium RIFOXYD12_FULL_39_22]|nr:MAG: hypothetical protein A2385_00380 [Bdellovibrionales bacterium RIFOXYB1_FULL_39_21]OFZ43866.1 MAG: hypothetical protein A2485_05150 [Bdellovibrionales bacterium RIFOXYC12_FULL_39_17]OFZ48800.1 MAG: hypothetical protein A2404_17695 [Bdellovibrionales bacterium RIFOXYC1_FULL_39_130]OFZ69434.1 MAG: hypothetical protein A2451_10825 [Bdellovibrionales bacterium RIFOXYC2_FULL_39_8]OFZ76533.1 MAG: hypothetical protein A2560_06360 [Bdellovibrionales bacterium RIFOXYD1_FULL_39_84]OFZ94767.1 MAG: